MAEINDQLSDTSSDLNWPIDHPMEGQQHDRVVFENVADQYVRGQDVIAYFTILQDIKVNLNEDQIGLLRVGCTNIKECLTYAAVQFAPSTTGAVRCGTATFPSSSLPVTDDEFYQFCYIINKTKNLGSSIPFQLNCAPDDIDILSNTPVAKAKNDGLIALADNDNDDIVIIHTKSRLTEDKLRQENRHLLDINRRLELQKEEYQAKLETIEIRQQEKMNKLNLHIEGLIIAQKKVAEEVRVLRESEAKLQADYDTCRSLCDKYQNEAAQYAERCRVFEDAQNHLSTDANQIRSQLAVTSQLAKDQATQIIDLERRLMQANELTKAANQRNTVLEQQLRDLQIVSEKYQRSSQGQIQEYANKIAQLQEQINEFQIKNNLLNDEINNIKDENRNLTRKSEEDNNLIEELQQQTKQSQEENETLQNEIKKVQKETNENNVDQQAYMALKISCDEIKKRCLKYQKGEVEAKRQLTGYQSFINDLQREVQDLTERLAVGSEEYKTLYRKYVALQRSIEFNEPPVQQRELLVEQLEPLVQQREPPTTTNQDFLNEDELVPTLHNTYQQENASISSARASLAGVDDEVRQCPVCYWEFPKNMNVDGKREHIEHHFQ
jgi:chromosome segregation ATPase